MFLSNSAENCLLHTDKMHKTYWKIYHTAVPKKTVCRFNKDLNYLCMVRFISLNTFKQMQNICFQVQEKLI